MAWIPTVFGAVLILVGLNDVFHTLFHPGGQGRLSTHILRGSWRLSQRLRGRPGQMVGPVGILLIIVVWTVLQALGWALVYVPHVPSGFLYAPGIDPGRYPDLAEALYISLVTLATLGYGDVVAVSPVLRLLSPLQAITGFILFTAGVSWLLQLYSTLSRRRALGLRLSVLRRSRYAESLTAADESSATVLHDIAEQLVQIRVDLGQNSETYYFAESDTATCLPLGMQYCQELSHRAKGSAVASVASAGATLEAAVMDLSILMRQQFVPGSGEGADEVIEAALADHACDRGS